MYGRASPLGAILLAGVVDRDDGRMIQRGGVLRLAAEPHLERRIAGKIGAKQLDRHIAAET